MIVAISKIDAPCPEYPHVPFAGFRLLPTSLADFFSNLRTNSQDIYNHMITYKNNLEKGGRDQ